MHRSPATREDPREEHGRGNRNRGLLATWPAATNHSFGLTARSMGFSCDWKMGEEKLMRNSMANLAQHLLCHVILVPFPFSLTGGQGRWVSFSQGLMVYNFILTALATIKQGLEKTSTKREKSNYLQPSTGIRAPRKLVNGQLSSDYHSRPYLVFCFLVNI